MKGSLKVASVNLLSSKSNQVTTRLLDKSASQLAASAAISSSARILEYMLTWLSSPLNAASLSALAGWPSVISRLEQTKGRSDQTRWTLDSEGNEGTGTKWGNMLVGLRTHQGVSLLHHIHHQILHLVHPGICSTVLWPTAHNHDATDHR